MACASSSDKLGADILARAEQISSGATSPSMLKTLSVTINLASGRAGVVAQGIFKKLQIAVRIDHFLRAREADAVDQAGVIQRVGENNVAGLQQELSRPTIRRVA